MTDESDSLVDAVNRWTQGKAFDFQSVARGPAAGPTSAPSITSPDWTETPKSGNIHSVAKVGSDLLVKFRNGGTYRYPGQAHHHGPMLTADSAGSYLHQAAIKHLGIKAG